MYYTFDQGSTWQPSTSAQALDGSAVNAIVVDASGHYYAGTSNGTIYSSINNGQSWNALPSQPSAGGSISSLAIDDSGTLYTVTANTTTQPQYNTAPLTTGTWQLMIALPADNATTIAAVGTTAYVGTSTSSVMYTSNKGATWSGNQVPNDTSGVTSLFVNKAHLSPLFAGSYGAIPINASQSDCNATGAACTITVKNLSSTTVTNVQANPNQLPAGVTQNANACASVTPGGSCSIVFNASGTTPFSPLTFDIIDSNNHAIYRSALISSITPNNGTNYYYVYNVNGGNAYVVDRANASNAVIWSSNNSGFYDGGVAIYGISEASTSSLPDPNSGSVTGQTACYGAIDGSCDANNIYVYYQTIPTNYYAEGLCYQNTGGNASAGAWYLPSACELNGGIYLNLVTNNFESCSPALTSLYSLHSLGALGAPLSGFIPAGAYWSSTEDSNLSQYFSWVQGFGVSGSGNQNVDSKAITHSVRCARASPL